MLPSASAVSARPRKLVSRPNQNVYVISIAREHRVMAAFSRQHLVDAISHVTAYSVLGTPRPYAFAWPCDLTSSGSVFCNDAAATITASDTLST